MRCKSSFRDQSYRLPYVFLTKTGFHASNRRPLFSEFEFRNIYISCGQLQLHSALTELARIDQYFHYLLKTPKNFSNQDNRPAYVFDLWLGKLGLWSWFETLLIVTQYGIYIMFWDAYYYSNLSLGDLGWFDCGNLGSLVTTIGWTTYGWLGHYGRFGHFWLLGPLRLVRPIIREMPI